MDEKLYIFVLPRDENPDSSEAKLPAQVDAMVVSVETVLS